MKHTAKRFLSLFLVLALLFGAAPFGKIADADFARLFAMKAQAASESDLTFELDEDGESYHVSDCNESASGALIIPSTYCGKPVTSIGYYAFYRCTGLTSITIPNSVTSIGDFAFSSCTGLTSIIIPDSVTSIGDWAFVAGTDLTSITVESGNTVYDSRNNCNAIIETATNTLLFGCKNTVIPNTVKSIGYRAFGDCTGLTSITIGNSVTSIGDDAFSGCTGLTSITVESGNTVYDSRNNCNAIIETASNTLMVGCKNTIIPNSVKSIGDYAFYDCTGLTSITIPDSVKSIGGNAFYWCIKLTSITIPDSVMSIGSSAFYNTAYYNNNSNWVDGVLYIGNHLIEAQTSVSGSYSVKTGTKTIAGYAFSDCTGLTSITLPNSVTSIGYRAFEDCTGLTSIIIPNSVTSIGDGAFSDCTGLTSITIPNSVTSIGDWAFVAGTDLTSITVESGNTVYDSRNNCNAIIETATNTLLFGCKNTVIPNTVKSIGDFALSRCTGLTSIIIPNSVTSIGDGAFQCCTGLTSIIIPNSVTSVGYGAFDGCTGLTSITIPNGVTSIEDGAFYGCTGLTSVTIPNSVMSIGWSAFYRCTGLTSVTISNSVTSIGWSAFAYCTGLTSITIPNSVTSIEYGILSGCEKLRDVCYLGTPEQWAKIKLDEGNEELTAVLRFNPHQVVLNGFVEERAVEYKSTVTFHYSSESLPEGAAVHWFVNGADKGTGESYAVKKAKASYSVQPKVLAADGTVLSEGEIEQVTVDTSTGAKFVAFFKMLFFMLPKIDQK